MSGEVFFGPTDGRTDGRRAEEKRRKNFVLGSPKDKMYWSLDSFMQNLFGYNVRKAMLKFSKKPLLCCNVHLFKICLVRWLIYLFGELSNQPLNKNVKSKLTTLPPACFKITTLTW